VLTIFLQPSHSWDKRGAIRSALEEPSYRPFSAESATHRTSIKV
jgi:hypothetical protein